MALHATETARLHTTLTAAASRGGGWPYYAGKRSRIEPTCWALLALRADETDEAVWRRAAAPHLQWLAATQRADGLLADEPGAPANFASNGLAACVLLEPSIASGAGASVVSLPRLLDALVAAKGVSVKDQDPHQDNSLQGWPWLADTFSWLEPTCWCVLALKKAGARAPAAAARIQEADRLIANRVCESGGWNYGNASVVGQDLRPYVPTTALALIAMHDRRNLRAVERSIEWLRAEPTKEPSASALALAAIALRIYDVPAAEVDARLAGDVDRAERIGNLQALAMMLYALTTGPQAYRALRTGAVS